MASNEEIKFYSEIELRHTTTMVQEINSNGLRLISKKEKIVVEPQGSEEKPKMTTIRHTRSIMNDYPEIMPNCEVTIQETLTEDRSDQVTETKMTP